MGKILPYYQDWFLRYCQATSKPLYETYMEREFSLIILYTFTYRSSHPEVFRTLFPRNTSGWLLLYIATWTFSTMSQPKLAFEKKNSSLTKRNYLSNSHPLKTPENFLKLEYCNIGQEKVKNRIISMDKYLFKYLFKPLNDAHGRSSSAYIIDFQYSLCNNCLVNEKYSVFICFLNIVPINLLLSSALMLFKSFLMGFLII